MHTYSLVLPFILLFSIRLLGGYSYYSRLKQQCSGFKHEADLFQHEWLLGTVSLL